MLWPNTRGSRNFDNVMPRETLREIARDFVSQSRHRKRFLNRHPGKQRFIRGRQSALELHATARAETQNLGSHDSISRSLCKIWVRIEVATRGEPAAVVADRRIVLVVVQW